MRTRLVSLAAFVLAPIFSVAAAAQEGGPIRDHAQIERLIAGNIAHGFSENRNGRFEDVFKFEENGQLSARARNRQTHQQFFATGKWWTEDGNLCFGFGSRYVRNGWPQKACGAIDHKSGPQYSISIDGREWATFELEE